MINLRSCCILLVDSVESKMMHGLSTPKYGNVKTGQCKEWRTGLRTEGSTEDCTKLVFLEEVLRLANNCSFLRIDPNEASGKLVLVLAGENYEYLL